jgi:hypothetical protein
VRSNQSFTAIPALAISCHSMKFISTVQIEESLRSVRPTQIAVAYVGRDWKDYVDVSALREVIVSPTIGSNPYAIQQIVSHIGWEQVHFLPNLHTKLYIGESSAAFGSFNLSRNGIGAKGLEEFGAVIHDDLNLMHEEFSRLRETARAQFPSTSSKQEALQNLRRLSQIIHRTGAVPLDVEPLLSLENYSPLTDHDFFVVCFLPYHPPINTKVVADHVPTLSVEDLLSNKIQYCTFLEEDEINSADWILLWQASKKRKPDGRTRPTWLHVGEVIPKGVSEEPYSKLVIDYYGPERPKPPFTLDDKTVNAIYSALAEEELSTLCPPVNPDEVWTLANSRRNLHRFLELTCKYFSG